MKQISVSHEITTDEVAAGGYAPIEDKAFKLPDLDIGPIRLALAQSNNAGAFLQVYVGDTAGTGGTIADPLNPSGSPQNLTSSLTFVTLERTGPTSMRATWQVYSGANSWSAVNEYTGLTQGDDFVWHLSVSASLDTLGQRLDYNLCW